jgi:hypothetical protein
MKVAWLSLFVALPIYGFGVSVLEPYTPFQDSVDLDRSSWSVSRALDETYRSEDIDVFSIRDASSLEIKQSNQLSFGLDYVSDYHEVSIDDDDDFSFESEKRYFRPEIQASYSNFLLSSGVKVSDSRNLPLFLDFTAKWDVFDWFSVGSMWDQDGFRQMFSADTDPEDDVFDMDMATRRHRQWVTLHPLSKLSVSLFREQSDVFNPLDNTSSIIVMRADAQRDEVLLHYQYNTVDVHAYVSDFWTHPYVSIYDQDAERLGWLDVRYKENAKGFAFLKNTSGRFWSFQYDYVDRLLFDGAMTLRSEEDGFGSILGKYYTVSHFYVRSNHVGFSTGKEDDWSLGVRYSRHDFSGQYTDADRVLFIMNTKAVPLDLRRVDTLHVFYEKAMSLTKKSRVVGKVSQYLPTLVQRRSISTSSSEGSGNSTSASSSGKMSSWGGLQLEVRYEVALN